MQRKFKVAKAIEDNRRHTINRRRAEKMKLEEEARLKRMKEEIEPILVKASPSSPTPG